MGRRRLALGMAVLLALGLGAIVATRARSRPAEPLQAEGNLTGASGSRVSGHAPPLLAPAPFQAPRGAREAGARTGVFEGQVLSAQGRRGIRGAELTFSGPEGTSSVTTLPNGTFTFRAPREGSYRLAAVTAPGYLPFAPEWGRSPVLLESVAGSVVSHLTFFLSPLARVQGQVLEPAGTPLANAEVEWVDDEAHPALATLKNRVATDARGHFELLTKDGATLEARHAPFAAARAKVQLGRELTLQLTADEGAPATKTRLSGSVVDESSSALEGAQVTASGARSHEPHGSGGSPSSSSDPGGRFALELLPGRYSLTARLDGYVPTHLEASTSDGPVVLRLKRGGTLTGRVVDAAGAGIPSFTIEAWGPDVFRRAVIHPEGRYTLGGLAEGVYQVQVAAAGYAPSLPKEVHVGGAGGAPVVADFTLSGGARLSGIVVDGATGNAVPHATVTTEYAEESAAPVIDLPSGAITDAEGRFEASGLRPGRTSILVVAEGYHRRLVTGLSLSSDQSAAPIRVELSRVAPGESPGIELTGIGAVLNVGPAGLTVRQVLAGGGAAGAGLLPGDVLLRADGVDLTGLDFTNAVELLRGPEGTSVTLTVSRDGQDVMDMQVWRSRVRG